MSQFMSNPTGAALTNPTDPLSSLAALERRKQEMAQAQAEFDNARARARAKREAAEAARRPASVEAPASVPSAPAPAAAPAAKPNASTSASTSEPDKYSLLRKAAQDRYQAELSRMADVSTSGGVVPPLSSKRAGQRYENELNRLEAIQAMERDRAARREALVSRVNERKAAQAARRAQIAATRQRENADIASQAQGRASDIIQAAQSVNPSALQERQFLDRLLAAPAPQSANPLRQILSQTPTGRLMDLATGPIEQLGPGAESGEPIRARSIAENDYLNDLRDPAFGDPTYMGPRRPPLNQPDLTDLSAADPISQNPFYRGPIEAQPGSQAGSPVPLEDMAPSDLAALDPVYGNPFFPGSTRRSMTRQLPMAEMTLSDLAAIDPLYGNPGRAGPDLTRAPRLSRADLELIDPAFGNPLKPGTPNPMSELPASTDTQTAQDYERAVAAARRPSPMTDTQMEMTPDQLRSQAAAAERQRQLVELARLLRARPGGFR